MRKYIFQRENVGAENQFSFLIMAGISFDFPERKVVYRFASTSELATGAGRHELDLHYGIQASFCRKMRTEGGDINVYKLQYNQLDQAVVPIGIYSKEHKCLLPAEFTTSDHPLVFDDRETGMYIHYYLVKEGCYLKLESSSLLVTAYQSFHYKVFSTGRKSFSDLPSEDKAKYQVTGVDFFTKYQKLLYDNNEFFEANWILPNKDGETKAFAYNLPPLYGEALYVNHPQFKWTKIDHDRQLYVNASKKNVQVGKRIIHGEKEFFQSMQISASEYIACQLLEGMAKIDKPLSCDFKTRQANPKPAYADVLRAMKRLGKVKITTAFAIEKGCEEGVEKFKEIYNVKADSLTLTEILKLEILKEFKDTCSPWQKDDAVLMVFGFLCSRYPSKSNPLYANLQGSVQIKEHWSNLDFGCCINNYIKLICREYFIDASVFNMKEYGQKATPGCYQISLTPIKSRAKFKVEFTLILV